MYKRSLRLGGVGSLGGTSGCLDQISKEGSGWRALSPHSPQLYSAPPRVRVKLGPPATAARVLHSSAVRRASLERAPGSRSCCRELVEPSWSARTPRAVTDSLVHQRRSRFLSWGQRAPSSARASSCNRRQLYNFSEVSELPQWRVSERIAAVSMRGQWERSTSESSRIAGASAETVSLESRAQPGSRSERNRSGPTLASTSSSAERSERSPQRCMDVRA
eukprot:scaffold204321_cov30-Tisochrysis_lutea.AAC.1